MFQEVVENGDYVGLFFPSGSEHHPVGGFDRCSHSVLEVVVVREPRYARPNPGSRSAEYLRHGPGAWTPAPGKQSTLLFIEQAIKEQDGGLEFVGGSFAKPLCAAVRSIPNISGATPFGFSFGKSRACALHFPPEGLR